MTEDLLQVGRVIVATLDLMLRGSWDGKGHLV